MTALLSLRGLVKRYGALTVIDGVSVELPQGSALGVLGPNGAGKSTLFGLISGALRADAGSVWFAGADLGRSGPHRRARLGIARSHQIPQPFGALTVFENLLVAACFGAGLSEREAREPCAELLARSGLLGKADRLAGSLPLLDRKRLELARALATRPRLLLLDEIAGGLTEPEAAQLVELLLQIRRSGVTLLWTEHVVHALLAVADRLLVLRAGSVLAEGEPREVLRDPEVRRVYMGSAA